MGEEIPLLPILQQEIESGGGMISFRRYMELALYHPDHGYYASGRARVGKAGDFYTSVSVGRIYGRLLASVCREIWEGLDRPAEFTVVEQGANDGRMAADILGAAREARDGFASALHYRIVEPFAVNESKQREILSEFEGVSWHRSNTDLPEFIGIHLSNELLDAFPVDSLKWTGSEWEEECVSLKGGLPTWGTRPIKDPGLAMATRPLPVPARLGWRFEINRGIGSWLTEIASRMKRGVVLIVDYGQAGEDRFAPHRADGTLLAFRQHERFDDPLSEPGLRDITAQVDFTDLAGKAKAHDFTLLAYSDQQHFLVGAAEPWMRSLGDSAPEHRKDLLALNTLITPAIMGSQFKVLALGRDFSPKQPLACFRYQRPGIGSLGI
jgi:SAM-dependent MidA family methyltransferase